MCGRFTLASDETEISAAFPGVRLTRRLSPRYNIAPTQDVAAVSADAPDTLVFFRWGLIPSWSKDTKAGAGLINARAETLSVKPSFAGLYKRRRCIILADGFYEWRKPSGAGAGTPYYFKLASGAPFAFAGLWDSWSPGDAPEVLSAAVITTVSNETVAKVHDRMPVILGPEDRGLWLVRKVQDPDRLSKALRPYTETLPELRMEGYEVSREVNDPKNDTPACVERVRGGQP